MLLRESIVQMLRLPWTKARPRIVLGIAEPLLIYRWRALLGRRSRAPHRGVRAEPDRTEPRCCFEA